MLFRSGGSGGGAVRGAGAESPAMAAASGAEPCCFAAEAALGAVAVSVAAEGAAAGRAGRSRSPFCSECRPSPKPWKAPATDVACAVLL